MTALEEVKRFFYTLSKNTLQSVQVQLSPCKIDFNVLTFFPTGPRREVSLRQIFFCDWAKAVTYKLVTIISK